MLKMLNGLLAFIERMGTCRIIMSSVDFPLIKSCNQMKRQPVKMLIKRTSLKRKKSQKKRLVLLFLVKNDEMIRFKQEKEGRDEVEQ